MLSEISRRHSFPCLEGMTYLNTAAEGIPPLEVGAALTRYFHDRQLGMDGRLAHEQERNAVKALAAELYGLSSAELGICSNSSEAYNLAALALQLQAGDEVIINELDFPAGATPWMQPTCPATTRLWRARDGGLRVEDLIPLLNAKTRLVTVSLVSFFNGFMIPLPAVVEAVRAHSSALLALDVTQALGRIPLDLTGVDLVVSSTHKWILASHGGCLVGVPKANADIWTVQAGGWFNLENAFDADRFERVVTKRGADSFTVGMPNYPAVYAIRAALDYLDHIGVDAIASVAQPLVATCMDGLAALPVELLTPREPDALAGILAFRHPEMARINRVLHARNIHVMAQAGRMRISLHGYNTEDDVAKLLEALEFALNR